MAFRTEIAARGAGRTKETCVALPRAVIEGQTSLASARSGTHCSTRVDGSRTVALQRTAHAGLAKHAVWLSLALHAVCVLRAVSALSWQRRQTLACSSSVLRQTHLLLRTPVALFHCSLAVQTSVVVLTCLTRPLNVSWHAWRPALARAPSCLVQSNARTIPNCAPPTCLVLSPARPTCRICRTSSYWTIWTRRPIPTVKPRVSLIFFFFFFFPTFFVRTSQHDNELPLPCTLRY